MKTFIIKNQFALPILISGLALMEAGPMKAQSFTTLHGFTGASSDGALPLAGLILSGNTLYGTTSGGGISGRGAVFAINIDGTGYTNLYSCTGGDGGENPFAGLILSDNILYGTTSYGGSSNVGNVFALNPDGLGYTNLYSFTSYRACPYAGLVLSSNILYGTAYFGGVGIGSVFKVNIDGTGFMNLHSFTGGDGENPASGLILKGNTLYGTAKYLQDSTLFAVSTDGSGFTNLCIFSGNNGSFSPSAGLVLSGNILYGTSYGTGNQGGSSSNGTVFKVNIDGTNFTTLHTFVHSDGAHPVAGLVLSGNTLFGTTSGGGLAGKGVVFKVNTDGTGYTILHSFTGGDGENPLAGLILSGNTLYGTTYGGMSGQGTVFSIRLPLPPPLTLNPSGPDVVLTWPTNATSFTLHSTTNLMSPLWNTVSPAPVVVNGQNVVTNPISGTQRFYRLIQ